MRLIDKLKRQGRESATWRGHKLGRYVRSEYKESRYTAKCEDCGMGVYVDPNPPANGIDVAGEAVALTCKGKKGPKPITQREFTGRDFDMAAKIAKHLGYTQTAYTSSSDLIGLFCLRDRPSQRAGCVIKTEEFGFMFVQDCEDIGL